MRYLRKYGEATTVTFGLREPDGVLLKSDAVYAAGDITISKDEGVDTNTTNGFIDEGKGYSLTLTATEMQAARIQGYIEDQTTPVWLGREFIIETYGHASAQYPYMNEGVYDRVLTSATHNVANSGGKRIRDLKEQGGYEGGFIYIDTVGGTAGSDSFVNGTVDNPVDNITDLNILSAALNINSFKVTSGSLLTFAAAQEKQSFIGESWTLALGGQSVSGSFFHGAAVSGICTGAIKPKFEDCEVNGTTMPPGHFDKCGFNGTMITGSAGDFFFADGCHSSIAGTGTPVFDYGAAIGATNFNFRGYHGGIKLLNMLTGDNFSHDGDGQIIIDASCTGGTMRIAGHQILTGADAFETAGGIISDDARFAIDQLEGVGTTYLADVIVAEKIDTLLDINKSLDFTVNTTTRLEYQWLDTDGDPVNITGLTFKFKAVKNAGEASPAIAEVTGTISDGPNGRWYFDVLPTTVFKGRYEIWSIDGTPTTTTLTKAGGARIETHPRL
jgi:hypothetical protein